MKNAIYLFFINDLSNFGLDLITVITLSIVIFIGILFSLLKFFNKIKKTNANRLYLVFSSTIVFLCVLTFSLTVEFGKILVFYISFTLAVLIALSTVFLIIENREEIEEEELTNVIDRAIENADDFNVTHLKVRSEPKEEDSEVDFSHVKNVIERLERKNLNSVEKKQINSLKEIVFTAETEGITPYSRRKINDGLSDLLKIMSRYGV